MDIGECPFCKRIQSGLYDFRARDCVVFEPLDPVTPGHRLVVPVRHATNAGDDPHAAANALFVAAAHIHSLGIQANIITSIGPHATQTVMHTHIHVVPRQAGDGLHLPWTPHPGER